MAVATWEQVAVALGRPTSDFTAGQQAQITWWISGAELAIVSRFGPVADLDAETVKYVEVEAVAAKVRAAHDEDSMTVTVDDGTVTRRYRSLTASDISADLWGMLSPAVAATAYTIQTSSPLDIVT